MNLTELFLHMTFLGAEWVLWILVALSFLSVAIIFERIVFYSVRRVNVETLTTELKAALRAGNLEHALSLVRNSKAIECIILAAGISQVPRGVHAVSEAMLSTKARERLRLDAYLPVLGTVGSNAPFIGLLGTVLGIVKAAHDMTNNQGNGGTANAVMAGVFEALVATAVGLCVAIPAVIAFNIFQRRVRSTIGRADSLAHLLLAHMKPESAPAVARTPKPPMVPDGR
jgi:biopolymer transport protein ExbB